MPQREKKPLPIEGGTMITLDGDRRIRTVAEDEILKKARRASERVLKKGKVQPQLWWKIEQEGCMALMLKEIREMGAELEHWLRMRVHPIGVKLLRKSEEVPEGAIIPTRDWGHKYALCQSFSRSQRSGETIAMFKEDHWCAEPVVGLGLLRPSPTSWKVIIAIPTALGIERVPRNGGRMCPVCNTGSTNGSSPPRSTPVISCPISFSCM